MAMTENLKTEYLSNNNSLKKLSDDELKQVIGGTTLITNQKDNPDDEPIGTIRTTFTF